MIYIKPHHFIDIIKLYGAGYEKFTPDLKYGHSFYKVGNTVLLNHDTELMFTVDCDDVCENCKYKSGKKCLDSLLGIDGYTSKDEYNKLLDNSIIKKLSLSCEKVYTAFEYAGMLYANKDIIDSVWTLENGEITKKRNALFFKGCQKYLEG